MKLGRNDPCPCGSGKKYKKCCYLAEGNAAVGNTLELQNTPRPPNAQGFDDFSLNQLNQESLLRCMMNMRMALMGEKPHIKEYNKIRKMHGKILDAMVHYYEDGKFERRIDTNSVSQDMYGKTVQLLESHFDFNTETGAQAAYDTFVYKSTRNMSCITEDFIQNSRYKDPEKIELLHSMLNSKLGLFEVTGTNMEEGYAYIKNVFTGTEYTMLDIGLSGGSHYDTFYLYTRIITFRGFNFGTGLNFIFKKNDSFILKHIQEHKENFEPNAEFVRFTQLYNRYSKDTKGLKVLTQH